MVRQVGLDGVGVIRRSHGKKLRMSSGNELEVPFKNKNKKYY